MNLILKENYQVLRQINVKLSVYFKIYRFSAFVAPLNHKVAPFFYEALNR